MNTKKILCIGIINSLFLHSALISVKADNKANTIKDYLLLDQAMDNKSNYNTNNDNEVNVLDFCRMKSGYFETASAQFTLGNAEVDYSNMILKVPINVINNTAKIISAQLNINFDSKVFSLRQIDNACNGSWSYSKENNSIQFTAQPYSPLSYNGTISYIEFNILPDASAGNYQFFLSDIQSSVVSSYGQTRELSDNECPDSSDIIYTYLHDIVTTTATTPVTTVTTASTTAATTVTTAAATPVPTTTVPVTTPVVENIEISPEAQEAMDAIIQWRKELGWSDLIVNNQLCQCAQIRAQDLSQSYSESRPDGSSLQSLLSSYNAPNCYNSCEYRNRSITSASRLVTTFRRLISQNPGHAVDDPNYRNIGVGYYDGYWSVILT